MNTGMECGENVKARATTRFHWCTLPVTRDAAEAALLPSRSRKPGTGTGHRLAFQTGQGTKGKVCWLRRAATVQAPSPDSRRPSLGAASRYSPDAAVSRRALSRVNAVVPARRLTRAAAEARMRRGRWSRGRATSWRTGRAGRVCVGVRWCARQTGGGQPVEVRRKEGVTDHLHPESCAGRCEAAGEALTGARTDGAIEHRKQEFWSAETVTAVEGHTDITATGEGMKGSCARLTGEG